MAKTASPEKSQRERFEQIARELGVDLDEEKLKRVLGKIAGAEVAAPAQPIIRESERRQKPSRD